MSARIQPGDGDPRHGSENGYTNLKCHCTDCRAAHAIYYRDRRYRIAATVPFDHLVHGRASTYLNYMCRCDACRQAANAKRAAYKRAES